MSTAAVEVTEITKWYGDIVALDAVTLSVSTGSVYGLEGPNGAGKTTLLGILAGLRSPSAGSYVVSSNRVSVLPDIPRFEPGSPFARRWNCRPRWAVSQMTQILLRGSSNAQDSPTLPIAG